MNNLTIKAIGSECPDDLKSFYSLIHLNSVALRNAKKTALCKFVFYHSPDRFMFSCNRSEDKILVKKILSIRVFLSEINIPVLIDSN